MAGHRSAAAKYVYMLRITKPVALANRFCTRNRRTSIATRKHTDEIRTRRGHNKLELFWGPLILSGRRKLRSVAKKGDFSIAEIAPPPVSSPMYARKKSTGPTLAARPGRHNFISDPRQAPLDAHRFGEQESVPNCNLGVLNNFCRRRVMFFRTTFVHFC